MKDQLVTFETAKLAKEKGLIQNLECNHTYCIGFNSVKEDKSIMPERKRTSVKGQFHLALAPTQSLLQKWLREKHKIHAFAHPVEDLNSFLSIVDVMTPSSFERIYISDNEYNNFENALERSLKEGLKLLKDKK